MRGGEQWRDVPGYGGLYQVSDRGQVRTWKLRNGKGRAKSPAIMKQFERKGCYNVSFKRPDTGESKQYTVAALVYMAFVGPIPQEGRVLHRSANSYDNRPQNLVLGCNADQARRAYAKYGPSRRRPVLKINKELEIVGVYRSAREAERLNYFSSGVVAAYCSQRRLSVIAGDGYIYAWDDDRCLARTLRRAMAELDDLGISYNNPFTAEYYNLPPDPADGIDLDAIQWADAPCAGGGRFRGLTA